MPLAPVFSQSDPIACIIGLGKLKRYDGDSLSVDALLDFVGEIYEASYNPDHWDHVAVGLCRLLNARSGAIFLEDHESGTRDMIGASGLPRPVRAAYRFGMSKYDHTFQIQRLEPLGEARNIIRAEDIRHEHPFYYRLILKPNDIGFLVGMNVYNDHEWHVGIGLHRSFQAEAFSEQDSLTLQRLYPHFKRALRIHKEFHRLRTRQQTLESALGRFMTGLIVIGPDGLVSYRNPVAEAMLAGHKALSIDSRNQVRAHYPQEHQRLQALIDELLRADRQDVSTRNQAIGLNHPDREHALTLMLAPLDDALHEDARAAGSVALYLCDPDSAFNLPAETLRSLYDMTPTEAGVTIALVNGRSPAQISEDHGVRIDTVRSQLKSIYYKMGVNKQQDVIRVLLSGVMQVKASNGHHTPGSPGPS